MFTHLTLGSNDVERSKRFYDAIFAAVGAGPGTMNANGAKCMYQHKGRNFIVGKPLNGEPATFANGFTIGFEVDSPEQGDAWHAAGVAAGGTSCEDPPGVRGAMGIYVAYLRDPDGNKLCALHRPAA